MLSSSSVVVVCDSDSARREQADGRDAWWRYGLEVLGHLRLACRWAETVPSDLASGDVVVLLGPSGSAQAAIDHAQSGGVVLALGGPPELARRLGIAADPVETGLVSFGSGFSDGAQPLRAFGGTALAAPGARVVAEWSDGRAAAVSVPVGAGSVQVWGADPWHSIVRIQQGWPITGKGTPAPDGSVPMTDGILRCDDGLAMPYEDRRVPPGYQPAEHYELERPPRRPVPIYDRPHADWWRVRVLEAIAAAASGPLAWLHYWPAGVGAIAHMSMDSDRNQDDHARVALDAFAAAGDVKVTWCHCHPGGYSAEVVRAIADAGHEQALHYNAREDTPLDVWGSAELGAQLAWAEETTGAEIVSNKNHYTRWEGWTEFFDWCEALGIEVDESRGPSKQGDIGFLFGSAHVWFPIADHTQGNRVYDVLELPLHTQDLGWFGHGSVRDPILDGAVSVHGVAHFLFHGGNMQRVPQVVSEVGDVVAAAAERGMPWWTAGQINAWERKRRGVELEIGTAPSGFLVTAVARQPVPHAGVTLRLPPGDYAASTADGAALSVAEVSRHGISAIEVTADLVEGPNQIHVRRS